MSVLKMRSRGQWIKTFVLAAVAISWAMPGAAFQFSLGDVEGSLDTTISYGLSWRMEDADKSIIGIANGGTAYSLNGDDGNLNYDKGDLTSNTAKITSELALDYNSFGLFVRGSAFYDFENYDGERERTQLSDAALDLVGRDIDLLDAYISWDFDLGNMPGQIRVGNQVLSWGESTFIQNGINVINPFDVSKLRVPGAELKEGLVPVGLVSASISPTENLTFEAFYQYDWEEVVIDPPGSYWSTNDFAGESGDRVMLGFGAWSDLGESWGTHPIFPMAVELMGYPAPADADGRFNMVPRGPNVYADNDGQYGLAMRIYAPDLNDTEFGFYYMNYHSRLPVISARTGTGAGALQALTAGTAAGTFSALSPTIIDTATLISAVTTAIDAGTATGAGGGLPSAYAEAIATGAVNAALVGGGDLARAYATNEYAQTAQYMIEYPEDIQLFGVSFNTTLGSSGVALQGEVSHRLDVPLQVDDLELLFAALGPLDPGLAAFNQLANALDPTQFDSPYEQYLQGYKRMDVSQVQATATKLFGPTFGADQFVLLGEVGVTHVHNMPDKDELRFEGPGTYISGNEILSGAHAPTAAGEFEDASHFADATSWGYRLISKLDFNNAIGAVTLSPRIAWAHDVDGITPGPGGNFIEGRKAVTFGIGANYQNTWTADLSYTEFFGAGRHNLVNDRDFVALNIKYSF
ncbi:MAG: DUF1302 domain-containing protein [Desulfuromonadales bacterium]|nr:DUF1302 domain-containing protein [Desulfuromonadales bacterium]